MTADESRAVIALWQQERVEQTGLTDRPAVPDVAEGLDIPLEEVQRLLTEVRAQRLEEEQRLTRERDLAEAMLRLTEEEVRLSEVQQQRAEMRLAESERRGQDAWGPQEAGDEPVPWEVWKATHPPTQRVKTESDIREEVNQQSPPYLRPMDTKVGAALRYLVWGLALSLLGWIGWLCGLWGPH